MGVLVWAVVWVAFYVVGTGLAIWSLRLWGPSASEAEGNR